MLNHFYRELLSDGGANGGGGLSCRTVAYCHAVLRSALKEAVRWSRISRNPADLADPPRQGSTAREMRVWSAEELKRFLEHVRDDRLRAAWVLAGTTGMRRGELLGLRWKDVDLETGKISITQTLVAFQNGDAGEVAFSNPKTASGRRQIALDDHSVAVLSDHRRAQLEERLALGPDYEDRDLVVAREDGSWIHPETFSHRFRKRVKDAGLATIRLHDLRHTHVTLALQAGINPKVVSERLGHANIVITLNTYSHVLPSLQEEAAERVAALVFA